MIIDNTEQIKKLITGCGKDEFYMLQIIHRTKDGHTKYEPQDKKSREQVIKTYFVSGPDYLDKKMEEIKDLCRMFNARAMFNLNRKSWKQISLKSLELMAQALGKEGNEENWWKPVRSVVESACGQTGACDKNKTWVVDVDCKDTIELEKIKDVIRQCEPLNEEKIIATVPTLHGYHLISKPFNKAKFANIYGLPLDIHDNNPTLLFAETKE